MTPETTLIVGLVLVGILVLVYIKRMLDIWGVITGLIVALFVAEQAGLGGFLAIILFFLVGEAVTRYVRAHYRHKEHAKRSTVNIIGNIGPALLALILNPVAFNVGYFASLSAAFADTLSSEIGVLSKHKPLLITTLQPVEAGIDGGVSVLGFVAAAFGGFMFGLIGFWVTNDLYWLGVLTLAGILGSVLDSVIGATLQRSGYTDNNLTNFLSALIIGIFFALLF